MAKQVIVPDEKGRNFARSIRVGQLLFISGMTGQWDLKTWERDQRSIGDIAYQTRRSLEWMQQVLAASGLTMKDVVKTTTFVRSIDDVNAIGVDIHRRCVPLHMQSPGQIDFDRVRLDLNLGVRAAVQERQ